MRKIKEFRCEQCKSTFLRRKKVRRFCSLSCFYNYNIREHHSRWKDNPNYGTSHRWMSTNFGNPSFCENIGCSGMSEKFDWALKKNRKASRNRNDYLRLCRSCHMKYDMNDSKRLFLSEIAKKQARDGKTKFPTFKGKHHTEETKRKMSEFWHVNRGIKI